MRKSILLFLIGLQAVCAFLAHPNYLWPASNWFSALLIFFVPIPFCLIMFIYRGKEAFLLSGLGGLAVVMPSALSLFEIMNFIDEWMAVAMIFIFIGVVCFVFFGLVCLGAGACVRRFPGLLILTIPVIITGWEFLRLILPIWIWFFPPPELMFAFPLTGMLPLIQMASLTGLAGVEFLVIFVSTVLAFFGWQTVLRRARLRSWFGVSKGLQPLSGKPLALNLRLSALLGLLLGLLIVAGNLDAAKFYRLQNESERGFKPALLQSQFDPASYSVWKPRIKIAALKVYQGMIQQAAEEGADLLMFTENALPMIWPEGAELWDQVRGLIREVKIPALLGVITTLEDQRAFNIWYLVDGKGKIQDKYIKQFLITFGEYLPMRGAIDLTVRAINSLFQKTYKVFKITAIPHDNRDLSRGKENKILQLTQGKLILRVCDEIMFPGYFRKSVRDGGEVIIVPAAGNWFKTPVYHNTRLQMAQFRAVETRRWVGYVSSMAGSAYFDALGRIHSQTPFGQQSVNVRRMPLLNEKSLYVRFGDWLGWLCVLLTAFFLGWQGWHWMRKQQVKRIPSP